MFTAYCFTSDFCKMMIVLTLIKKIVDALLIASLYDSKENHAIYMGYKIKVYFISISINPWISRVFLFNDNFVYFLFTAPCGILTLVCDALRSNI